MEEIKNNGLKTAIAEIICKTCGSTERDACREMNPCKIWTEGTNKILSEVTSAIEVKRIEFADYILYMTSPEKAKLPKTRQRALEIADKIISHFKGVLK